MRTPVRPGVQASTRQDGAVTERQVSEHRVSTQLGARLAERRRALRRMRWRTIAIGTAAVIAVAAVVYLVLFSPVLALRSDEVQITGTGEFVDAGTVEGMVGAHAGEPLARLDASGLGEQVESLTGVLSADVGRQWPNGLQVAITPREPIATVADDEGYLVLDADAVQLDVTDEPREDLPLVQVEVGTESAADALAAVVTVLGELPPELFELVTSAGAASADQVELELTDGSVVIWGSAEENELKAAVLDTLRQVPADIYDVSAPRNPTTRG